MSYLQTKFGHLVSPKFRIVLKYLHDLKIKLIEDKDLHIKRTVFFLNFPYNVNYGVFKLLKK